MEELVTRPAKGVNGAAPAVEGVVSASIETTRIVVTPDDQYNQELVANVHPPDWVNPTPDGRYNLLVIGGGSAGLVAAVGGAGLGAKVALVEHHLLGGDCLNVGCVPSKSVIRSSKLLGELFRSSDYGVNVPDGVEVDFGAIMRRMRRIRSEISSHDSAHRFKELGIDLYLGEGRFVGPNTFEVDGRKIEFKKAVIATGSRPTVIPIPGLVDVGFLTNVTLFELTELPQRLAVIGSGPIGSELSQAFNRFGSQVTLFDVQPRVLGREDADAAAVIAKTFAAEGIRLALGAQITHISQEAEGKAVHYALNGESRVLIVDEILLSVGRTPNIDTLDLDAAGIEFHRMGVTVDDTLQTTNPSVFAAGDVGIKYQFTHTADATARIVLQNALFPGPNKKVSDLVIPWTTYTDPEVAHVGLYPADAEEKGIVVETIVQSIGDIDRGKTDGELDGFVKVHIKKGTDQIVGATIVASHAGEMINELTLAITAGIGLKTLATVIHPYPTQGEAIRKVADTYNRTRLTPTVQGMFKRWMSWTR